MGWKEKGKRCPPLSPYSRVSVVNRHRIGSISSWDRFEKPKKRGGQAQWRRAGVDHNAWSFAFGWQFGTLALMVWLAISISHAPRALPKPV